MRSIVIGPAGQVPPTRRRAFASAAVPRGAPIPSNSVHATPAQSGACGTTTLFEPIVRFVYAYSARRHQPPGAATMPVFSRYACPEYDLEGARVSELELDPVQTREMAEAVRGHANAIRQSVPLSRDLVAVETMRDSQVADAVDHIVTTLDRVVAYQAQQFVGGRSGQERAPRAC
ncbi:hypothetical protein AB0346_14615 [Nocardia beijingensis]|uniref:hypothetical protein n=1 Tax=Nocardia beijingensis TaxID=95162 RepID=UPI00344F3505